MWLDYRIKLILLLPRYPCKALHSLEMECSVASGTIPVSFSSLRWRFLAAAGFGYVSLFLVCPCACFLLAASFFSSLNLILFYSCCLYCIHLVDAVLPRSFISGIACCSGAFVLAWRCGHVLQVVSCSSSRFVLLCRSFIRFVGAVLVGGYSSCRSGNYLAAYGDVSCLRRRVHVRPLWGASCLCAIPASRAGFPLASLLPFVGLI